MELNHKVALVTGGGSGIGKATAHLFAQEGARVLIIGRTPAELEQTTTEIAEHGGTAAYLKADIASATDMKTVYQEIERLLGRLDVVFAHAGINGVWAPIEDLEPDEWETTLRINLTGTFHTVKYALPLLKKQGGAIVITSSVNGTRIFSNAGASAYSSSKAGQLAFMQMAALELARYHIRVNAICPGAISTDVEQHTERRNIDKTREPVEFPEGKIPLSEGAPGRADQVAQLVLFLCSERASHITGTPVWIDGAESLLMG